VKGVSTYAIAFSRPDLAVYLNRIGSYLWVSSNAVFDDLVIMGIASNHEGKDERG